MSTLPAPLPAGNPCGSCPYRRDAPAGLWHPEELSLLTGYDAETWEQPRTLFLCHQVMYCSHKGLAHVGTRRNVWRLQRESSACRVRR